MKFVPLFPWWSIVCVGLVCAGWGAWILVRSKNWRGVVGQPRTWRIVGIVGLLVLMACGPSVPGDRSAAGVVNLDVIVAIDRTPSMSAEDYNGTSKRLDGVKKDALALLAKVRGARIALITFDSTARLVMPFTSDSTTISTAIQALDQEASVYSKGSRIDEPLDITQQLLTKAKQSHTDRGRLLFYFGDGEQTNPQATRSFAPVAPLIDGGAVFGYGTAAGGKMHVYYGYRSLKDDGQDRFIEDRTTPDEHYNYPSALSKIDERNLRTTASQLGVAYEHRNSPNQPFDSVIRDSKLEVVADTKREVLRYANLSWLCATGVIALLSWWIIELLPTLQRGLTTRRRP